MKFTWTRPDGSKKIVATLDDYHSCFEEMDSERDKAVADGRPTDAAQLEAARSEIFTHYLDAQLWASKAERAKVQATLERCQLCLPWWQELNDECSGSMPPWDSSPAQKAIFAHGQIMPESWEAANAALELLPEYAPPPNLQLGSAISLLQTVEESAIVLRDALDTNLEAIEKVKTDLRKWDDFRDAIYPKYLIARTAFDTAAEALDAAA